MIRRVRNEGGEALSRRRKPEAIRTARWLLARCVALACALAVGSVAVPVAAQTDEDDPELQRLQEEDRERAREIFALGLQAFQAGDYVLAADRFVEAYAYDPNPRLALNAAHAFELAGNRAAAIEFYQAARDSSDEAEVQELALEAIERLRAEIAAARPEGEPPPPEPEEPEETAQDEPSSTLIITTGLPMEGATATLDDGEPYPVPAEIPVDEGTYTLRVQAPGHRPFRQIIDVGTSQDLYIEAQMRPLDPPAPAGRGRRIVGWSMLGTGAALGAGGFVAYLSAKDRFDTAEQLARSGTDRAAFVDERDAGESAALLSTLLYASGAAVGTAGLLMVVIRGDADEAESARGTLRVLPDRVLVEVPF